ncbi:putative toxin [Mycolicibacter minnesotensis]
MSTDVDPELFYDAAVVYKQNSDTAAAALGTLSDVETANASGGNGVGPQWARSYDSAADDVGQVAFRLVNVFHNLGNLLRQNGINHDQTEAASTLNQHNEFGDPVSPAGETTGTYLNDAANVGTVAGGDDPEPPSWGRVADRITDGWPNGDPSRLWAASSGWKAFGQKLVEIDDQPSPAEQALVTGVTAAEIGMVNARMGEARILNADVAGASGDLARAAKSYGDKLETTKFGMKMLVAELNALDQTLDNRYLWPLRRWIMEIATSRAAKTINGLNSALRATAVATTVDLGAASLSMSTALPAAKTLLDLVPRRVNATPTERVNDNRRKGSRAEERAGIDPNAKKRRINVKNPQPGRPRFRIPDEIDDRNRVLREVKNVKNLTATQQLRDMAEWAREQGYQMVIVVDKGRTNVGDVEAALEAAYPGLDVVIDQSKNLS